MAHVRTAPTRSDTFKVTVMLNGQEMGIFDKKTGGDVDSNETKYQPGNMAPMLSLGGVVQPQNLTLQREYDRIDDHDQILKWINAAGKGQVTVSQRPLDLDGNPYGKAIIWRGKLKRVLVPDVDSESNNAALLEIEVSVASRPTTQ